MDTASDVDAARPRRARRLARGCALIAAAFALLLVLAYRPGLRALAGGWDLDAGPVRESVSPAARALFERALAGLDPSRLIDVHAHLAGIGTDGSGCEVNARMRSWRHPLDRARFDAYLSASGVRDLERGDAQFVEVLARLARDAGARHVVLAFDRHFDEAGVAVPAKTEFHVPNDWARRAVALHPDRFLLGASVHPYRPDALAELERVAALGAKLVKWLPNAMGIDPASPRCDAFYAKLVELDLVLLTHTGRELAVDAGDAQALGNPLRLRRALDAGVTVIAAHCASLGDDVDLDDAARPRVPSLELFLRLMDEPRYADLLFGDLSALTNRNRSRHALDLLLLRRDLHARFLHGSDWPLPAVDVVVELDRYVDQGFLRADELAPLRELYDANPLAFDLALKRSLRHPDTGAGFAEEAFLVPAEWGW